MQIALQDFSNLDLQMNYDLYSKNNNLVHNIKVDITTVPASEVHPGF